VTGPDPGAGRPPPGAVTLPAKIRRGLAAYATLGFVGECMTAAAAHIEHLEGELARKEAMDALRAEARGAGR
jgi:hypothetical protein